MSRPIVDRLDLTGHVVAVTGAGGRLGQRLGRLLLRRGATLAAIDRPEPLNNLDVLDHAAARAYPFDATDEDAVRAGFERIREQQGRLDALVHAVGTWAGAPLLETPQADFERLLRVNLTSTFLCFREAARQMQAAPDEAARDDDGPPGKRLIGIASRQGADRGAARQYGYSASKAGVVRLVEAAADELKETGITAHAVAPSTILFDEATDRAGVPASRLVALIEYVLSPAGDALSGAVLRAYGSA